MDKVERKRRPAALVRLGAILLILPWLSGCGGGSLCCGGQQGGAGQTQVIIQSDEQPAAPPAMQRMEKGGTR